MKKLLYFVVSALVAGSLVFAVSCSKEKKTVKPTTEKQTVAPVVPASAPVPSAKSDVCSVDFSRAPLSEVVQFVTTQTGYSFILNGTETAVLSWVEFKMDRQALLDSFARALNNGDMVITPTGKGVYTIVKAEEVKVPVRLDFGRSSKGVFFIWNNVVYHYADFPYPTKFDGRSWFAFVPKSALIEKAPALASASSTPK